MEKRLRNENPVCRRLDAMGLHSFNEFIFFHNGSKVTEFVRNFASLKIVIE